jgi:heat shock protein HtpX
MPKINIIEDSGMNAFASGIDDKSYTVTLTTGIIDALDDDELAAVVAHELTHIKNRDTRLLVVCIVFVGIFSTLMTISVKILANIGRAVAVGRGRRNKGGGGILIVVAAALLLLICSSVAFFFGTLTRLAISRRREYVADAGGAELCGNPVALASALRKISSAPGLGQVRREDVAQLYIVHPDEEDDGGLTGLVAKVNLVFCTHPDTPERIRLLEQF